MILDKTDPEDYTPERPNKVKKYKENNPFSGQVPMRSFGTEKRLNKVSEK
jgi:hypothetical protein